MEITLIKTKDDFDEAVARVGELMDAAPGSSDEDELELLSVLIENYEKEHFPIPLPDPIEAIKFCMEQQGLTRKDMVKYFGSPSKVSEVLNRKRPLSISMIRALEKGLGIPAEVLIQEPVKPLEYPRRAESTPAYAIGEAEQPEDADRFEELGELLQNALRLWSEIARARAEGEKKPE